MKGKKLHGNRLPLVQELKVLICVCPSVMKIHQIFSLARDESKTHHMTENTPAKTGGTSE